MEKVKKSFINPYDGDVFEVEGVICGRCQTDYGSFDIMGVEYENPGFYYLKTEIMEMFNNVKMEESISHNFQRFLLIES